MENMQNHLFQSTSPTQTLHDTIDSKSAIKQTTEPVIGDLDHQLMVIVASYIQKIPDKRSRKQIARLIINALIKSADLLKNSLLNRCIVNTMQ